MSIHTILSKTTIALACFGLLALASAGCSRDVARARRDYIERGDQYMKAKNVDAAIIEYRNALQQDPRFADAYRKLSMAYLSRGDGANALRSATTAADLVPDVPEAQIEAGNLLLLAGRFDAARAHAERVLTRDPKNLVAHVLLGNATAGLKDFDSAMKEFEEAIRLDPHQTSAYASLAALKATKGDREAAERNFKQAIAIDPKSTAGRLALAQFYWSARQFTQAEQTLKEAVAAVPGDQRADVSLAVFYEYTGRSAEAEPYLRAAVDSDPNPQVIILLADYYIALNRTGDAISLLQRMTADTKLGEIANIRLAAIAESQGRPEDAVRIIDQALAADPKSATVLAAKADLLLRRHKLDEALSTADAAAAADPSSAPAAFIRGRVLVAKGRLDQAGRAFEEVLRLNPRAAAAGVELAHLHLRSNAPDTVALATKVAQANPRSLEARLTLARAQMQQHDYAAARPALEQLARAAPGAPAPEAQLGSLLLMKNDAAGARDAFNRALAIDPFQLEALGGLTALDIRARHQSEAIARLKALLDRAPKNSGLLMIAAAAYSSANDPAPAEALLLSAIEIDPGLLAAYSMLGRVYLTENRLDAARAQFEKVAREQERPVGALTLLGMIDQIQNRIPEAQQAFERALQADPHAGVAANNLAWIYAEKGGSLEMALQLAEIANTALPNQPDVSDTLGWIYYKKNLLPLAITTLQHCLELDPKNSTALYHLALVYDTSGNRTEARRMLEQYLTLDPASERRVDAKRRLEALGG
jgi:putative PEP-CTERM system TPR-repeat lipoprotein